MPKPIVWAVTALLCAVSVFGFIHENLFAQELWKNGGLERWIGFTAAYWVVAALVLRLRPEWLVPITGGFALAYSEWWCWQFADPIAPLAALFFLGSCFCLGRAVLRNSNAISALLIGLAIWIFILSIGVHFPINRPWAYAVAFAIPYATMRPKFPPLAQANFGFAALIYLLLLHLLVTLKPEVSTDALAMHLAIPDMIARDHKFAFDFQHYAWSVMPMGGDFAFTATYLLGGETAARLLNFAMLCAIIAMVYRGSRRWLDPNKSALAAALFASTPLVQLVTGSLLVENVWTAFLMGATMALWEGETILAGALFGAAFTTKVGTSAFLVPAVVIALFRNRDRRLWVALALLIVLAAPPYVNAWIKTGNPIFPFANHVFHSPYFDTTTPLKDVRYQQPGTWDALYNLAFRSSAYLESQNGALGFQYFVLLLPLLVLCGAATRGGKPALERASLSIEKRGTNASRQEWRPHVPIIIGIAAAILTFASLPNLRYLYPALPMLSMGLAWMIAEMPRILPVAIALGALNVWFLPSSGWYHNEFALFTQEQIDEYVKFFAPARNLVNVANRIAPGEPIAMFQIPAIADLRGKAYLDTWHTPLFWKGLRDSTDTAQIAAMFRKLGIRYLITPIPPETNQAQFIETWTAPTGKESGREQIRMLLGEPISKPREVHPAGPGTYDDLDSRIEYSGSWLHDHQFEKSFAQSITYSNQSRDTIRFFFSGRSIAYVYTMAFNRGIAEVLIDGQPRPPVDLYSKELKWQQQTVFSGLEPGPHTIEIRVGGGKNAKSSGRYVDLDRLIVSGQ